MKPRTLAILAAPTLGLVFLQLVVALTVPLAGLFCGILISLVAFGLFRFFEVEFTSPWWPAVLPAAMSLLGIVILFASRSGAPLYLYGPYLREGVITAPSNLEFDASLRAQNPEWGVRDLAAVVAIARENEFSGPEIIEMPANNLSVIFRRA